jgi:hypothetical protein
MCIVSFRLFDLKYTLNTLEYFKKTMSKYEDYDRAYGYYNNERSAVCADTMAAMIQFHTGKQLKVLF